MNLILSQHPFLATLMMLCPICPLYHKVEVRLRTQTVKKYEDYSSWMTQWPVATTEILVPSARHLEERLTVSQSVSQSVSQAVSQAVGRANRQAGRNTQFGFVSVAD